MKRLLTRHEAARYLSMGVTRFDAEIRPSLRIVRTGRKVLVPIEELDRWVDERKGFAE